MVDDVKLDQQFVELPNEVFARLEPRSGLLVGGDVDGVGLDDDLSGLCDGFFGGFSGDETFDLLQGKDGGLELDLWETVVGLVEEGCFVVGGVDVAEDGASGSRAVFHTTDGDDDWATVSVFFFAAFCDTANVAGSQDERSTWMVGLGVVVVLLFTPSLRRNVQTHVARDRRTPSSVFYLDPRWAWRR